MEAATLFTLAGLYWFRAGCVCAVIANRATDEFTPGAGVREAIMVANEAIRILQEADRMGTTKTHSISDLASAIHRLYSG